MAFKIDDPRPWAAVLAGSFTPYPWLFFNNSGDAFCESCATNPDNEVTDGAAYFEGPGEYCDDCGDEILSAYGTPEGDEK